MHEVLFPPLRDIRHELEQNFAGMTVVPVEFDTLLAARERMARELQQGLTADERRFLLSLVAAEPEWSPRRRNATFIPVERSGGSGTAGAHCGEQALGTPKPRLRWRCWHFCAALRAPPHFA